MQKEIFTDKKLSLAFDHFAMQWSDRQYSRAQQCSVICFGQVYNIHIFNALLVLQYSVQGVCLEILGADDRERTQ